MISKACQVSFKFTFSVKKNNIIPRKVVARRLETKVAKGLIVVNRLVIKLEIPKRDKLPNPPPIKTAKS